MQSLRRRVAISNAALLVAYATEVAAAKPRPAHATTKAPAPPKTTRR